VIFTLATLASSAMPVATKVRVVVLSITLQEGRTLIIVAKEME
jgi:hypothetical protein